MSHRLRKWCSPKPEGTVAQPTLCFKCFPMFGNYLLGSSVWSIYSSLEMLFPLIKAGRLCYSPGATSHRLLHTSPVNLNFNERSHKRSETFNVTSSGSPVVD